MSLRNNRQMLRTFYPFQVGVLVIVAVLLNVRVEAKPFTRIVSFGDSLSDTGNIFDVTSKPFNAFFLQILFPSLDVPFPPPPYFDGRFSNGPVWVERLAERLGVGPQVPSEKGGFNYAVGGATTFDDGNFVINLILPDDVEDQVAAYLRDHTPNASELFIVEGGANDLLFGGISQGSVPAGNIEGFVVDLHEAGARNFLVPNLPSLGKIPGEVGGLEEVLLNGRTVDFNTSLSARLDRLENTLSDITIFRVNFNEIVQTVLNDPSAFGFTNVTGIAFNEDTNQVVSDPDEYLFWDYIHPTGFAHQLLGDLAADVILPPCSFNVDLSCDLSDINLMFAQGNLVEGVDVPPVDFQFDLAPVTHPDQRIDRTDIDVWLAQSATENRFEAAYRRGDGDLDRDVDITDFNRLSANFDDNGYAYHSGNWQLGNFDGDGDIDITDFNFLAANFSVEGYGGRHAIPEPATFVLLLSVIVLVLPWCSCRGR